MGDAVQQAGGRVDKFIGDGMMALFEAGEPGECGAMALAAAKEMADRLVRLNGEIGADQSPTLKIGIGVHTGPAVLGRMGYGPAAQETAIGDTVNIASRLEQLTKEFGCRLVVSGETLRLADRNIGDFQMRDVEIRGISSDLKIAVIEDAGSL